MFVAAGSDGLFECRRDRDPERLAGLSGVTMLGGAGRGDDAIVVAVSSLRIGRLAGGSWKFVDPPEECTFFDRAVGLAVGAEGTAYLANRWGDLRIWRDDGWTTVAYPEEVRKTCEGEPSAVSHEPEISGATVLEDGTVYLVGTPNLLFLLEGDALAEPPFAAAARTALARNAEFTCLGRGTGAAELWIGTNRKQLLQVDRESGRVTAHAVNLFGGMRELLALPGDRPAVMIAAQTDVGVLVGREFCRLPGRVTFAEDLVFDPDGSAVLAASRDGITVLVRDGW